MVVYLIERGQIEPCWGLNLLDLPTFLASVDGLTLTVESFVEVETLSARSISSDGAMSASLMSSLLANYFWPNHMVLCLCKDLPGVNWIFKGYETISTVAFIVSFFCGKMECFDLSVSQEIVHEFIASHFLGNAADKQSVGCANIKIKRFKDWLFFWLNCAHQGDLVRLLYDREQGGLCWELQRPHILLETKSVRKACCALFSELFVRILKSSSLPKSAK